MWWNDVCFLNSRCEHTRFKLPAYHCTWWNKNLNNLFVFSLWQEKHSFLCFISLTLEMCPSSSSSSSSFKLPKWRPMWKYANSVSHTLGRAGPGRSTRDTLSGLTPKSQTQSRSSQTSEAFFKIWCYEFLTFSKLLFSLKWFIWTNIINFWWRGKDTSLKYPKHRIDLCFLQSF